MLMSLPSVVKKFKEEVKWIMNASRQPQSRENLAWWIRVGQGKKNEISKTNGGKDFDKLNILSCNLPEKQGFLYM